MVIGDGKIGRLSLLHLNVLHALWSTNQPKTRKTSNQRCPSAREPSKSHPNPSAIPHWYQGSKAFQSQEFEGHVCNFSDNRRRLRYIDNGWEELTDQEMERFVRRGRRQGACIGVGEVWNSVCEFGRYLI